jgi:hypothetical protein
VATAVRPSVANTLSGSVSLGFLVLAAPRTTVATDWATADIFTWPTTPAGATDPTNLGKWADLDSIPNPLGNPPTINPVHAAVLLEGSKRQVFIFRNQIAHVFDLNYETETTFDARDGGPDQPANRHEFFCSGHAHLPDGKLLIVGGNRRIQVAPNKYVAHTEGWASLFDPAATADPFYGDSTDTDLPAVTGMDAHGNPARWYPTVTELPDGKMLLTSGTFWFDVDGDSLNEAGEYFEQKKWVVLDSYTSTPGVPWSWALGWETYTNPATPSPIWSYTMTEYPHFKVLPTGLFYAGNIANAPGGHSRVWLWDDPNQSIVNSDKAVFARDTGCCVPLTLEVGQPARVMLVGGAAATAADAPATAEIIAYTTAPPYSSPLGWEPAVPGNPNLLSSHSRRRSDAVVLADGSVLLVGGEYYTPPPESNPHNPNWECEIYHPEPVSPYWAWADSISDPRRYHSVAILLPDGRVFAAGDEAEAPGDPPVDDKGTYEIFYPPYLFESSTAWAKRPEITGDVSYVTYGLPFILTVGHEDPAKDANDIAEVVLMSPGTSTHSTNMTQRRLKLASIVRDDSTLAVAGPLNGRWAPPGRYMLIVLDSAGVPSVADLVTVGADGDYSTASGETDAWFGDVWLDRDFEVQPGGTLQILPGTTIRCEENESVTSGVSTSPLIELVVRGNLQALGASGIPITFTTSTGSGNFHGVRFDAGSVTWTGYGYQGCLEPVSQIDHVVLDRPLVGIQIEDTCAPSISNLTITNPGTIPGSSPSATAGIYLNGSDVVIPRGHWNIPPTTPCPPCPPTCPWPPGCPARVIGPAAAWNLTGPLNVVASNTVTQEISYGNPLRTDLIAEAGLKTTGTDLARVVFRPLVQNNVTGDDWGGLSLCDGFKHDLDFAKVSHAANPIFLFYPDSATAIRHTMIDHFSDIGLWVKGAVGLGGLIEANTIQRGTDLDQTKGRIGVFLDQADKLTFVGNRVEMIGNAIDPVEVQNGKGLNLWFGKTYCLSSPPSSPQVLSVHNNVLVGPGRTLSESNTTFSGIHADWVCGRTNQSVSFTSNLICDWNKAGLEMTQDVDVQVNCNRIELNRRGVDFSRNTEPTGSAVRFKTNWIQVANVSGNTTVRTDNGKRIQLGPSTATKGLNEVRTNQPGALVVENEPGVHDSVAAEQNHWFIDGVEEDTPGDIYNHASLLKTEIVNPGPNDVPRVDLDPLLTYPSTPPTCQPFACWPCSEQSTDPTLAVPGVGEAAAPDEVEGALGLIEVFGELPTTTSAGPAFPNPSNHLFSLPIAVSSSHAGRFRVAVYDVRGRRVAVLLDQVVEAGRYLLRWSGGMEDGRRVLAGVYFIRTVGPGFTRTSKVTVLE